MAAAPGTPQHAASRPPGDDETEEAAARQRHILGRIVQGSAASTPPRGAAPAPSLADEHIRAAAATAGLPARAVLPQSSHGGTDWWAVEQGCRPSLAGSRAAQLLARNLGVRLASAARRAPRRLMAIGIGFSLLLTAGSLLGPADAPLKEAWLPAATWRQADTSDYGAVWGSQRLEQIIVRPRVPGGWASVPASGGRAAAGLRAARRASIRAGLAFLLELELELVAAGGGGAGPVGYGEVCYQPGQVSAAVDHSQCYSNLYRLLTVAAAGPAVRGGLPDVLSVGLVEAAEEEEGARHTAFSLRFRCHSAQGRCLCLVHSVGSPPHCLDKGLPVRTWRLRGFHAAIRGPHQRQIRPSGRCRTRSIRVARRLRIFWRCARTLAFHCASTVFCARRQCLLPHCLCAPRQCLLPHCLSIVLPLPVCSKTVPFTSRSSAGLRRRPRPLADDRGGRRGGGRGECSDRPCSIHGLSSNTMALITSGSC